MPWRIRERDGEFCVVEIDPDDSDGDTIKCYEGYDEALALLRALYANIDEAGAEKIYQAVMSIWKNARMRLIQVLKLELELEEMEDE